MKKSRRTTGLAPPLRGALGTNFAMIENKGNTGPPRGSNTQLEAARDNKDIGTIAGSTR